MKIEGYPEYKDSSVEWVGLVPKHWEASPHRALWTERTVRDLPDEPLLSVTIQRGVIPQETLLANTAKKDSSNLDKSSYKLVEPYDLAYNKMRAWQGAAGISRHRGIVSPAYIVARLRDDHHDPRYFHYLFRTPSFAKEAERWSYGITSDQWSLRFKDFKAIYSPVPPPAEQAAIVRFLDYIDRRINRYIRAKRKLIKLLEEQKQAIIHQAVTRGLDPDVKMRPSGVEWLGDVPEHWNVSQLRRNCDRITDGAHISPDTSRSDYPFVSTVDLKDGEIDFDHCLMTTSDNYLYLLRTGCRPLVGDVLFSKDGTVGRTAVVDFEKEFVVASSLVIISPQHRRFESSYLELLLSSRAIKTELDSLMSGSALKRISVEKVSRLTVCIPPVGEQRQIVRNVRDVTSNIDLAIARSNQEIDLLHEYRARLIADVVTGKLDVRAVAAILPNEQSELEDMEQDEESETDLDGMPNLEEAIDAD